MQRPIIFLMILSSKKIKSATQDGRGRERPSNRVESITNIKSSVNLLVWNFMAFHP